MKLYSVLILILLVIGLEAQDSIQPIKIEDYFQLKNISDPQISPDGQWIAYTQSEKDLKEDKSYTRIWMVHVEDGESLPMTQAKQSASRPRWSPDGKYLTFLAARGEKSKTQIWKLNRRGGEAQQLSKLKEAVSSYDWSPDGTKILLTIKDPKPGEDKKEKKPEPVVVNRLQFKRDYTGYLDNRRNHLYLYTPGDTVAQQITFGDYDDGQAVWSPDGTQIAFVSNRSDNPDGNTNSDIWIITPNHTEDDPLIQVTTNTREDYAPQWSPDGSTLTYVTVTAKEKVMWYATNHLATIDLKTKQSTVWTHELDRNVQRPRFDSSGESIYFLLEDSGENQLATLNLADGKITREVQGCQDVNRFDLVDNQVALLMATPEQPSEIYSFKNGQVKQLTFANKSLLSKRTLSNQEKIHFASADGTEIEGFLYRPINYEAGKKYPLILRIHGGPVSQYDCAFRFEPQLFAAQGYVVLETNPRGSSGYGQDFSLALFADWGNLDYQDVMAGVDYVINEGIADPERMGVGGWSYGGILTNYVITKTDRFKGAISGASEALYRSNYGHDHYQRHWETELGLPWENAEAWERISPFNDVANITTPTLWMGGSDDWNVPIINSEQMYQAMKRLGRETQLVVYPGEHHGIRKPSFQKDRFERYLSWYKKYVLEQEVQRP